MSKVNVKLYRLNGCPPCEHFCGIVDGKRTGNGEWDKFMNMAKDMKNVVVQEKESRQMTQQERDSIEGFPTVTINGVTYEGPREATAIMEEVKTKLKQTGGSSEFYQKYLKYKNKYIQLKKKLSSN